MEHAVPGAVCFQMIEHHGCLWSSVAQLALRELTLHATPNVCSTLILKKLSAVDGTESQYVFLYMTGIAFEDIFGIGMGSHLTAGTCCISFFPRSMA